MRLRIAAVAMTAALTACGQPATITPTVAHGIEQAEFEFSVRPATSSPIPSLNEVQAGHIRAVIPGAWDAAPLPQFRYPQVGFIASPHLDDWTSGQEVVQGMEAFWVDAARLRIPSDYYYLAARTSGIAAFVTSAACKPITQEIVVDHPPDVTGSTTSPGDFVFEASGTCDTGTRTTRWAYVVVAPGFGPLRQLGIPNSGMYVVVAVVAARRRALLDEMMRAATFGETGIAVMTAAARVQ